MDELSHAVLVTKGCMKHHLARKVLAGIAAVGAWALFMSVEAQDNKVGKPAPEFSAKGSDGKTHTLKSLTANGPVFLYFIKDGCPINHEMVKYFNELGKAYQGKASLVGVIDGDASTARNWLSQYKAPYTLLLDPSHQIIRSYGAMYSPWAVMVEDGKIAKVWPGASKAGLTEMNALMAKAGKTKLVSVNLEGAPTRPSGG